MYLKSKNNKNKVIEEFKVNTDIKSPELRVLGDDGENLGVISLAKAIELAQAKDLDLVLISPKANPPVARITNFDKFRYTHEKEIKKQKRQRAPETKRIQISPRTAKNDLLIQLRKLEKFLEGGHRVEIQVTLRGREKGNREWAEGKLKEFMEMITTPHRVVSDVKRGGRGLLVQINPE